MAASGAAGRVAMQREDRAVAGRRDREARAVGAERERCRAPSAAAPPRSLRCPARCIRPRRRAGPAGRLRRLAAGARPRCRRPRRRTGRARRRRWRAPRAAPGRRAVAQPRPPREPDAAGRTGLLARALPWWDRAAAPRPRRRPWRPRTAIAPSGEIASASAPSSARPSRHAPGVVAAAHAGGLAAELEQGAADRVDREGGDGIRVAPGHVQAAAVGRDRERRRAGQADARGAAAAATGPHAAGRPAQLRQRAGRDVTRECGHRSRDGRDGVEMAPVRRQRDLRDAAQPERVAAARAGRGRDASEDAGELRQRAGLGVALEHGDRRACRRRRGCAPSALIATARALSRPGSAGAAAGGRLREAELRAWRAARASPAGPARRARWRAARGSRAATRGREHAHRSFMHVRFDALPAESCRSRSGASRSPQPRCFLLVAPCAWPTSTVALAETLPALPAVATTTFLSVAPAKRLSTLAVIVNSWLECGLGHGEVPAGAAVAERRIRRGDEDHVAPAACRRRRRAWRRSVEGTFSTIVKTTFGALSPFSATAVGFADLRIEQLRARRARDRDRGLVLVVREVRVGRRRRDARLVRPGLVGERQRDARDERDRHALALGERAQGAAHDRAVEPAGGRRHGHERHARPAAGRPP